MAITSIKTGSSFTNLVKYNDFLGPNSAYIPTSFESIASINGDGSSGTITFSSIPSTYASLQFRLLTRDTLSAANGTMDGLIRVNGDTGTNYSSHQLTGNGSSATADGVSTNNYIFRGPLNTYGNTSTNTFAAAIVDVHDYASTTKYKTFRIFTGVDNNAASTSWQVSLRSGLWQSTSAITSISFYSNGNAFSTTSTIALYGIKGA